jgi:hypothetical protein
LYFLGEKNQPNLALNHASKRSRWQVMVFMV